MYVSQQENECKGVVLDETGETVIGASVLVKGTSNGTITDLDGNFVIQNVKKGDVIVVSYEVIKMLKLYGMAQTLGFF